MATAAALDEQIARAAEALAGATALVVSAGAGMGVDSGLPDFRGPEGFWRAYPPYQKLGLNFEDLANPRWFAQDPALAWGFYGHRLGLYRRTVPHAGYGMLLRRAAAMPHGYFVYTSNVDGAFERAGFDPEKIIECHGTVHRLQCTRNCGAGIFPAEGFEVAVDEETFRASGKLPACPACGALARPCLLMFDDYAWDDRITRAQQARFQNWFARTRARPDARVAVVECGAGLAIPTVRVFSERVAASTRGALVRINLRDFEVPAGQVGVSAGALAALSALDRALATRDS